jgi:hypothetical protein
MRFAKTQNRTTNEACQDDQNSQHKQKSPAHMTISLHGHQLGTIANDPPTPPTEMIIQKSVDNVVFALALLSQRLICEIIHRIS